MIRKTDYPILRAFLEREASMFRWLDDGLGLIRKSLFVEICFRSITKRRITGDYFVLQSLTNMGQLDSELKLSCRYWVFGKGNVLARLPPTPRINGIHCERMFAAK